MGRIRIKRRGWSRRDFLKRATGAGALAAAAPFLPGCGDSHPLSLVGGTTPFRHGVASGDPLSDRVILWTRVTPPAGIEGDIPGMLVIADDPELTVDARSFAVTAVAARDWTVKLDATGLSAGKTYYYRFRTLGFESPLGRTRTAPEGNVDHLRLGVVSCSNFAYGYFNAYRFIAQRADLDAVLHLGDYIYEYGDGEYGDVRPCEPPTEIITLEDYRRRHAQYKTDPDLQEAHRQHPWICVWDDHETTNNSRRDSAENHTEGVEGVWQVRKAWGQQAYDEWMPIRLPEPGNPNRIWRRLAFGNLVDLWMLDTRLYDRDDEVNAITSPVIFDEDRRLIGPEQRDWLLGGMSGSSATWKLIGQQVMFGQLKATPLPDINIPLEVLDALPLPLVGGEGISDLYVNGDQWDGYQAERRAILDFIADQGVQNTVVLTGDIHSSWAMDLARDPDNLAQYNPFSGAGALGVEFVATSVSSPGLDVVPGLTQLPQLISALRLVNPHMKYIEGTRRGYLLLDITPEQTVGEFWYVSTVAEPGGSEAFATAYAVAAGDNHLSRGARSEPTPTLPSAALAP
jgi:alkaline phosphatase D